MIDELLEFVNVKEGQEEALKDYLQGKLISPEGVKTYLDTTEGKKLLQPILDRYHNKGLESWKQNNLEALIEEEVSRRNPAETEEQKRIRRLEQQLNEEREYRKRTELTAYAQRLAAEKGLPSDIVDFVIGADLEATETNIETFSRVIADTVQTQVKSRFKDTGRTIPQTRTSSIGEIESLKKQYAEAQEKNMPLQVRVKLAREIQELENMKE